MIATPESYDLQNPSIACFADKEACSVFTVRMSEDWVVRVLDYCEESAVRSCEAYFQRKSKGILK